MLVSKKTIVDWRYKVGYIFRGKDNYPYDIIYYQQEPTNNDLRKDRLSFAKRNKIPIAEVIAELTSSPKKMLHSETEPSKIELGKNGQVLTESWYYFDRRHREYGKPAYIEYNPNGSIKLELYYNNGVQYFLKE